MANGALARPVGLLAQVEPGGDSAPDRVRLAARLVRLSAACARAALELPYRESEPLLQAWSLRALAALGVELDLAAPLPTGARLIVANHLSWVDPLVLMALQPALPLAKAEVAGYPVLGPLARRVGLRFVRRTCPSDRFRALRQACADWKTGRTLLLFPEGTTTDGSGLAPLYRGGPGLAWRLGLPVLPIRLSTLDAHYPWLGDASLGPHLRGLLRAPSTRIQVHPRPLMHPCGFPDRAAWLDAVQAALSPEPFHAA